MIKIKKPAIKSTNFEKHTTKNPVGRFFLNNFLNTVVKTIRPLNIDTVLDAGCGEGFTLARLKKEKIGKTFEGIDNLDESLEIAKKIHPDLSIKKGDIYKLPFKNNSFDLVICTEVLEHLENPKKAYRELLRVSRKYVLLSVPNEPFFTVQRMARFQNIRHLGAHPEHIQHWGYKAFSSFVKIRGVKIVTRKLPIPWTMIVVRKVNL